MNWLNNLMHGPAAKPSPAHGDHEPYGRAPAAESIELIDGMSAEGQTPERLVAAICRTNDKVLATKWVGRVDGDTWLGEVAIHGLAAEVRLAAAQRIDDSAVLDLVARASRNKDKGVYRHCSDLLRQRRQTEDCTQRALALSVALRELLASVPLALSALIDLERQFQALTQDSEESVHALPPIREAQALLEQAHNRLQEESGVQRDVQRGDSDASTLLHEISQADDPGAEQIAEWLTRQKALATLLAHIPPWLATQKVTQNLAATLTVIDKSLRAIAEDCLLARQCEEFLDALGSDTPIAELARATWSALPKPVSPKLRQALEVRWQELTPASAARAATASPNHENPGAVQQTLDKLEQEIAEGHLAATDELLAALTAAQGTQALTESDESRLRHIHAQIAELRGWARWGTDQSRVQLIASAEGLKGDVQDMHQRAKDIAELRDKWKQLNAFGPASKAQWERFDRVLTKAFQPIAAYRAEEAVRHAKAHAVKVALCVKWEAALAAAEAAPDYPALEAQRGLMLKQWRSAEPASFRDERVLKKRFDALVGRIDEQLAKVRQLEIARCEQLIAAATALAAIDSGRVLAETRVLQDQWQKQKGPLKLGRGDEQRLWKQFHRACNAVFEKRDAARAAQKAEREATQAKQNAEREAHRLALQQQQATAQQQEALRREKQRSHHDLLASKAALAERIEAAAITPQAAIDAAPATSLEAITLTTRQAWDALPRLPGKEEAQLAQRFTQAPRATAQTWALGLKVRDALLLDLESLLGLPSPEVSLEIRRQRQLERLKNRFGGAAATETDAAMLVLTWYATSAPTDADQDKRIHTVQNTLEAQAPKGPVSQSKTRGNL